MAPFLHGFTFEHGSPALGLTVVVAWIAEVDAEGFVVVNGEPVTGDSSGDGAVTKVDKVAAEEVDDIVDVDAISVEPVDMVVVTREDTTVDGGVDVVVIGSVNSETAGAEVVAEVKGLIADACVATAMSHRDPVNP